MNDLMCNVGQTMSSLEIAELVESRHDSVKRTIDRLVSNGVIELPPMVEVKNHIGQTVSIYKVNERSSYIVVAQLSPEFTAKLVDFWQASKKDVPVIPDFSDPAAAARAWANEFEEKKLMRAQRDEAIKTKAEIGSRREATAMSTASVAVKKVVRLEKILERHDCKTMTELLEDTAISARVANIELETLGYLYTEVVNGKKRKRLTEKGEEIAKEFPSKKFIQIGVLPGSEDRVIDMILGR